VQHFRPPDVPGSAHSEQALAGKPVREAAFQRAFGDEDDPEGGWRISEASEVGPVLAWLPEPG
jgi:hypothetical protein